MRKEWVLCVMTAAMLLLSETAGAEDIPLNGSWRFAYTSSPSRAEVVERFTVAVMIPPNPQLPTDDQFALEMQAPGYWDNQLSYIPEAPWGNKVAYYGGSNAHPIRFPYRGSGRPRHPDAGLPYVVGVGWYKREIEVPREWEDRTVTLRVGGARVDTYCYVNGIYMDSHHGHGTPFEFDLTGELRCGETNELVLAVDNTVSHINSCALRGYSGGSGGIYGDISLHVSDGPGRLKSYYVYPTEDLTELRWSADLIAPAGLTRETQLSWRITGDDGETIREGVVPVRKLAPGEVFTPQWTCPTEDIEPWSIWEPNLYDIEVRWEHKDGAAIDSGSRPHGLRRLEQRDGRLFLNGRPILLRGICEIYFFPPDIHPPNDVGYFRERLERLKEVGFNFIRFHTWVPMEPYLRAADEVGMLMQPEHSTSNIRNPLDDVRWGEMIRWCRYHPSAVMYCGGNEEVGHEGLISKFAERIRETKALAPDALVLPMHTMSGPESESGRADLPLPPHFENEGAYYQTLWDRVTRYSDVFAARANDFSYSNFTGRDWREVEPEYIHFERPILAHESGIIGTYIDLSLESRYTGSMPADLYQAAREYITAASRLDMASTYYENSARWHGQARKFVLENLRKCDVFDGYDLLGAWDSHWHNSGYGCGLLNEFFEFKPGDNLERVLQYNGESVLLLDNSKRHVFRAEDDFNMPVMVSLYGGRDLRDGTLTWRVMDDDVAVSSGELKGLHASDGKVTTLGNIHFDWPDIKTAHHFVLDVKLNGSVYHISNQWNFWVFPNGTAPDLSASADEEALSLLGKRYPGLQPVKEDSEEKLRIVRTLTESDLDHLAAGGDILLLGAKPFPANETRFQIGVAGRAHMNLATVINKHPALKYVPHAGWCDWQFQQLLENGECIEFNKFPVEFNPIVEVVSSYKYIRLQSAMWEAQTEGGRIFVCSFNLDMDDPTTTALLDGIVEYVQSDAFQPKVRLSISEVVKPLLAGIEFKSLKGNDGNFYSGMSPF
ncbi:MAG: hypothetical protein KC964_01530 [Candidatus Omnitrophica bacterium]|nr:hypothetical protein [Candidatus Omnitrophota bacterium]